MNLTRIRYFLALATTLSFTRAAEQCNVTQPALTRAIQSLEHELGGTLILRERSLTQLTELGRTMLPLLQVIADATEAVQVRVAQHRRKEDAAPLRLGLAPDIPLKVLFPLLREVVSKVSGAELDLRRDAPEALASALLSGDIDVAVMPDAGEQPERLHTWPLWTEAFHLLAPVDHALAAEPVVHVPALRGEAVLAPRGAPAAVLERLRTEHGLAASPNSGSGVAEVETLVALGLGLGLVPPGEPPAGMVSRPLDPEVRSTVILAVVAGRPMNRAATAFTSLVRARRWEDDTVAHQDASGEPVDGPPEPARAASTAPRRSVCGSDEGEASCER